MGNPPYSDWAFDSRQDMETWRERQTHQGKNFSGGVGDVMVVLAQLRTFEWRSEFLDALEAGDVSAAVALLMKLSQQGWRDPHMIETTSPTRSAELETFIIPVGGPEPLNNMLLGTQRPSFAPDVCECNLNNVRFPRFRTPLHLAVSSNSIEMVDVLLEFGATPSRDDSGQLPWESGGCLRLNSAASHLRQTWRALVLKEASCPQGNS